MLDIFADLSWRGLIYQTTDDTLLPRWLQEQPRTVYAGFDPTSESLHVGNLLPLLYLRRMQSAGHRPIALIGGATGMIGDPSGKSEERNLLNVDQLRHNVYCIEQQMRRFLDFDAGSSAAILINNFDWMRRLSYLDFLRDIGKHFPVNVMMSKDSIKGRLGREGVGISYTEFSYMLLQAYDFVHLYAEYGCEMQVGGSDQWGNITAGVDLARRMKGVQLHGMTCPLLTTSDGSKMGKTESGAVWLDAKRTSPYAFYQYWIDKVADQDVGKCLRFLTELPQDEIDALDASCRDEPHLRKAQRQLATELTTMVHGEDGLATAIKATEVFFGAEITDLSDTLLLEIFADVPSKQLSRSGLVDDGLGIVDALQQSGLTKSKSDARRTIEGGGAYVNNRRVANLDAQLKECDLASETVMVLRSGKKRYALLRFVD